MVYPHLTGVGTGLVQRRYQARNVHTGLKQEQKHSNHYFHIVPVPFPCISPCPIQVQCDKTITLMSVPYAIIHHLIEKGCNHIFPYQKIRLSSQCNWTDQGFVTRPYGALEIAVRPGRLISEMT